MTWAPNKKSAATNTSVTLNATTFTKLADANEWRIFFSVSNDSSNDVWVNLRAVADAVDDTGIWLPASTSFLMKPDAIYTGEICAIAVSGTPTVKICIY